MDYGTYGDAAQRKGVADFGSGFGAAEECGADLESVGCDDVGFNTVDVVEKGDAGTAVGVVLDALHYCGDSVAISLEVYNAVFAFVATTEVPGGNLI